MPSRTRKQHKAMCAAADGRSTLGIPKSVGKEYCKADGGKVKAKSRLTGSAGRAAPSIASSARAYADGGRVLKDKDAEDRAKARKEAERRRRKGAGQSAADKSAALRRAEAKKQQRAVEVTERANRQASRKPRLSKETSKTRPAKILKDVDAADRVKARTKAREEAVRRRPAGAGQSAADKSAALRRARAKKTQAAVAATEQANRQRGAPISKPRKITPLPTPLPMPPAAAPAAASRPSTSRPRAAPVAAPKPATSRTQATSGPRRQTRTKPATSRSQAASGPRRQTRTQPTTVGGKLRRAVNKLAEMNKASVARARGHRTQEEMP